MISISPTLLKNYRIKNSGQGALMLIATANCASTSIQLRVQPYKYDYKAIRAGVAMVVT